MDNRAPVVYGKYQLLEQLARGGMAEVFKAKAHGVEGFEKILVIKRILPELSENRRFVEMFINEAKIAVTLSHANIVQVFDLGWAENTYFIAMEYVAGMDMARLLKACDRAKRRLPPELAAYIVSELAKGLDYAHRRRDAEMRPLNIVHRDVSPPNVLLSFEGEVKLTDFGIAKARTLAQAGTEVGIVKGKYAYMAPEQLDGGKLDARTDVFAAGTLLYKALSGVNPFQSGSVYDTLRRIRSGDVPSVRKFVPELPEEIDELLARAMAQDPESRFASAGDLYGALMQLLYTTGRSRVGARDLADYLVQAEAGSGTAPGKASGEGFQAALEGENAAVPDHTAVVEPQEETRVTRGRPRRRNGKPRTAEKSSAREKAEWRDVTVMAAKFPAGQDVDRAKFGMLVERFSGTLMELSELSDLPEQDALYAMFGHRNPDGYDTENAARCALWLLRVATAEAAEDGRSDSAEVAICAGRVLVDLSGVLQKDDAYRELVTAAGRLASSAEPGQAIVEENAEKALRGHFQLVPAGKEGQTLHLLTSERSKSDTYGRFVGRREELRRMGEVLAEANRGERRVVGLCGEAGSGRSRMLAETIRRLSLGGYDVGLHAVTLIPRMREVPLAAVQQFLRVVLGLDEFDPEAFLRGRTARLRELGLLVEEKEAIAAALKVPTKGDRLQGYRPIKGALQRMIEKLAEDKLTLIAWDGAEYMDDDSLALLDEVLRAARKARVAFILCYQPGFVPRWAGMNWCTEIELQPLADRDTARLIAVRLGFDEIPMELLSEVTVKCGGNPLYIEEYLDALAESGALSFQQDQVSYSPGAATVVVPKTLKGILGSRIARLGPVARYILQVASAAGERFDAELVAAAAEEDLGTVAEALGAPEIQGIIVQAGASKHAFAHDLIPQVIRDGLTLQARKEIHLALAGALETLHANRLDEMAERLAHHYREAGMQAKAVDFLVRAADRFEKEYALDGAVGCLVKAIEILEPTASPDRERMLELYERVGDLCYRSTDLARGSARMEKALQLAEGLGSETHVARFSVLRGRLALSAARIEEARQWLDQARHVARGVPDRELSRDVLLATASAEARGGEYERAVGLLREALQLCREPDDEDAKLRCLMELGLTYARMGDRKSAIETVEQARVSAGERPSALRECQLHRLETAVYLYAREYAAAVRTAGAALKIAKEAALAYECAVSAHNMGAAYLHLDDYKLAFTSLRYGHDLASEHGLTRLQMSILQLLGYIDSAKFGSEEGRALLAQSIEYAREQGYVRDVIKGKHLVAIADQIQGQAHRALQALREAQKLAAEHGHRGSTEELEEALRQLDAGKPIELPLWI